MWLSCVFSHISRVWLSVTPWTIARQAPLSTGFSKQKYCGGLPFPSPGDLPNLGMKPGSPALQADSLLTESKVINTWWWLSRSVMSDSCDPTDCSPPGSSVHGSLQARILEWDAISFSGDLPNPGIKPVSHALPGKFFTTELPEKPHGFNLKWIKLKATNVLSLYWPRVKIFHKITEIQNTIQ